VRAVHNLSCTHDTLAPRFLEARFPLRHLTSLFDGRLCHMSAAPLPPGDADAAKPAAGGAVPLSERKIFKCLHSCCNKKGYTQFRTMHRHVHTATHRWHTDACAFRVTQGVRMETVLVPLAKHTVPMHVVHYTDAHVPVLTVRIADVFPAYAPKSSAFQLGAILPVDGESHLTLIGLLTLDLVDDTHLLACHMARAQEAALALLPHSLSKFRRAEEQCTPHFLVGQLRTMCESMLASAAFTPAATSRARVESAVKAAAAAVATVADIKRAAVTDDIAVSKVEGDIDLAVHASSVPCVARVPPAAAAAAAAAAASDDARPVSNAVWLTHERVRPVRKTALIAQKRVRLTAALDELTDELGQPRGDAPEHAAKKTRRALRVSPASSASDDVHHVASAADARAMSDNDATVSEAAGVTSERVGHAAHASVAQEPIAGSDAGPDGAAASSAAAGAYTEMTPQVESTSAAASHNTPDGPSSTLNRAAPAVCTCGVTLPRLPINTLCVDAIVAYFHAVADWRTDCATHALCTMLTEQQFVALLEHQAHGSADAAHAHLLHVFESENGDAFCNLPDGTLSLYARAKYYRMLTDWYRGEETQMGRVAHKLPPQALAQLLEYRD
jgi:hypothetical protein